jgi:hypothetical protein
MVKSVIIVIGRPLLRSHKQDVAVGNEDIPKEEPQQVVNIKTENAYRNVEESDEDGEFYLKQFVL